MPSKELMEYINNHRSELDPIVIQVLVNSERFQLVTVDINKLKQKLKEQVD